MVVLGMVRDFDLVEFREGLGEEFGDERGVCLRLG